jgi:zinc transport system substrate-binding protein
LLSAIAADRPTVFVSILPQKYFLQRICGDRVEAEVMVQPGANVHNYEPRASQMAKLAGADIYFAIGISFEDVWLAKLAAVNPRMKVVRTDATIEKMPMVAHPHDEDGTEQENDEGIPDPHTWLSPPLATIEVQSMVRALMDRYPKDASFFADNAEKFLQEIDALDARLRSLLQDSRGRQFMVYHPAWGYFARQYGLEQVPVEIEGKQPKPGQLKALIEHARAKGIRVIFMQPQFSKKSAEIVAAEIGGVVAFADDLAYDWPANLLQVAEKIKKAGK